MIKVIPPGSFDFGMPIASLVDIHSRGVDRAWMVKRASVLTKEIQQIRAEPDRSVLHLISLGAQEAYGCNRNGDGFNEKAAEFELSDPKEGCPKVIRLDAGLVHYHPTFTKNAHVFKHHKNDDPAKKIGDVLFEAYNHEMKRGELLIRVPHDKEWLPDLEKLANGQDIPFSMACKVPYDICTACGNKARTRAEYCDHLTNHMTDITKTGHQIFAVNDRPNFFDISKVLKPADRIAYSLQKVAEAPVGGAILAERYGVVAPRRLLSVAGILPTRKLAAAQKLAAIEKLVEGLARGQDNGHIKELIPASPCGNIPSDEMEVLKSVQLGTALQALSDAKICLSVRDFLHLVMGPQSGSIAGDIPMVEGMLPGIHGRLLDSGEAEECVADTAYDPSRTSVPRQLKEAAGRLAIDHSLAEELVRKRAQLNTIRGSAPRFSMPQLLKHAAVSKPAYLAREYAKYQLAFLRDADDELLSGLTVLRNYLTV